MSITEIVLNILKWHLVIVAWLIGFNMGIFIIYHNNIKNNLIIISKYSPQMKEIIAEECGKNASETEIKKYLESTIGDFRSLLVGYTLEIISKCIIPIINIAYTLEFIRLALNSSEQIKQEMEEYLKQKKELEEILNQAVVDNYKDIIYNDLEEIDDESCPSLNSIIDIDDEEQEETDFDEN